MRDGAASEEHRGLGALAVDEEAADGLCGERGLEGGGVEGSGGGHNRGQK